MEKYNCSSFDQYANMLKKDIKAAMRGKIRVPADVEECECGFVEVDASKEQCEKIILDSVDEIVWHALEALDSGRATERLLEEKGIIKDADTQKRYIEIRIEESMRFNNYEYEPLEGQQAEK